MVACGVELADVAVGFVPAVKMAGLDVNGVRWPLPLELVELLLSSADMAPFCMSALTISCFASDVLVPGLVRLIFIFNDWWSIDILVPALPAPCPLGVDDIFSEVDF